MSRVPPHVFFVIAAAFHYLGPAFAVLLFAQVGPLGVAWLRIASAAIVFALWRRPWRYLATLRGADRWAVVQLGVVLALMNSSFYEAIARLPLGTVAAIEFVGPIVLAVAGLRTARNVGALGLAVAGVYLLIDIRLASAPIGYAFALANCVLFALYIVLGHRLASRGSGIDRLAAAMLFAAAVALPLGFREGAPALTQPTLLGAAVAVGISSSVIPYVCDQLAMARLPRATFALMLSLLPAAACSIGVLVLRQVPRPAELAGLMLVVAGVALHSSKKGQ